MNDMALAGAIGVPLLVISAVLFAWCCICSPSKSSKKKSHGTGVLPTHNMPPAWAYPGGWPPRGMWWPPGPWGYGGQNEPIGPDLRYIGQNIGGLADAVNSHSTRGQSSNAPAAPAPGPQDATAQAIDRLANVMGSQARQPNLQNTPQPIPQPNPQPNARTPVETGYHTESASDDSLDGEEIEDILERAQERKDARIRSQNRAAPPYQPLRARSPLRNTEKQAAIREEKRRRRHYKAHRRRRSRDRRNGH